AAGRLFARRWHPPAAHERGSAIVLFHDSLGSVELWRDFPGRLAAVTGRAVVAYDRLGFGRSGARAGPLPPTFVRDEAEDVVPRLRAALGLDAIVPFGHSVGGAMAIATAARWPEHCTAAVTMSAQSFVEEATLAGIRAARAEFARPEQFARVARRHGERARWVLDAWIETWLDPAFADWRLDDDLRRVSCPVLAMHGDRDEFGSVEHARRIARLAGGASRLLILEGCGHVPHREQPARVLDAVARFLAPIEPGPLA
ncbi:MAG TPA: alpha/beta hydrolase, partial [Gemmatimonadaceae bacterium]|nr:alpha/beta hydrolase [Gemmatimonadaceae bacterium]